MAISLDQSRCVGCGLCIEVCPNHALVNEKGKASFRQSNCNNCGLCDRMCMMSALVYTR